MASDLVTKPLYLQIRDIFSERIAKAKWRSREPIPNEYELGAELKVSIGTIRKAVDLLVAEGQVVRRQGRGTFVVDREAPQFTERLDRLRNADGSRIAWLGPTVSHSVTVPDERERTQLKLTDPAEMVIQFLIVRRDQSGPLKYERASVPCSRFEPSPDVLAYAGGLMGLCHACNITVGASTVHIGVAPADADIATALEVAPGETLMRLERVVADAEGVPIEGSVSWYALKDQYYLAIS